MSPKERCVNQLAPRLIVFLRPWTIECILEQTVEKYRRSLSHFLNELKRHRLRVFTIFTLPMGHSRRIRTTNILERVNREVKYWTERQSYSQTKRRSFVWSVLYPWKSVRNGKRLKSIRTSRKIESVRQITEKWLLYHAISYY